MMKHEARIIGAHEGDKIERLGGGDALRLPRPRLRVKRAASCIGILQAEITACRNAP